MASIRWLIAILIVLSSQSRISAQPEVIPLRLEYRFPPPDTVSSDYYIAHLTDIELLNEGQIAVLDQMQNVLLIVTETGELVTTIGRPGQGPGEFSTPWEVEFDEDSRLIWVLEGNRIQAFSLGDFSFSHMIRPTELRPRDMVAIGGNLYLSASTETATDLMHCYSTEGEHLGVLGTHLEREVSRNGRNLHKIGDLVAAYLTDGSLLFCYAYSTFNDILLIADARQGLVHSDYPVIVEQDMENRKKARDWSTNPREKPPPYVLVGNPVMLGDRLFLSVRYGVYQKEAPIIEMDLNGSVARVWMVPAELGAPMAFAVRLQDGEPVFWMGWSSPEPAVGKLVSDR